MKASESILVVDDDLDFLEIIKRILENKGYGVASVSSAGAAICAMTGLYAWDRASATPRPRTGTKTAGYRMITWFPTVISTIQGQCFTAR